jgi:hypothetical protein
MNNNKQGDRNADYYDFDYYTSYMCTKLHITVPHK